MKNIHYELYTRYYAATVGRFYTALQKRKLLSLFARGFGIAPYSEEFRTVYETLKTVDEQGIKDFNDSKNYQLICSILNSEDELFSAASALARCYEDRIEKKAPTYSCAIEWRASVCKSQGDPDCDMLEDAYIKYCCGHTKEALEVLCELSSEGSILALEHLAIINYENKSYEESLFNLLLLEKTIKEELCLEIGWWITALKSDLVEELSPDVVAKTLARVKKNARFVSETRAPIGFMATASTEERGT